MKRGKRLICLMLVLIMCFAGYTNSVTRAASLAEIEQYANETFMKRQWDGNEAYNRLLQSFLDDEGNYVYPDYYAGAYINDQGYLVVLEKGMSEEEKENVLAICNNVDVRIASAQYSFNELNAVKELVVARAKYAMEEGVYDCKGYSAGIRCKENKVYIGVEDITNEELVMFLTEGLNKSHFKIVEIIAANDYADYKPAANISTGEGGSTGCGAQYTKDGQTYIGFLTASHVMGNNYICEIDGVAVGEKIWAQNGGNLDVAFIKLYSGNTFTSKVEAGYINSLSFSSPAEGSTVYKKGNATGNSAGTVMSTSEDRSWYSEGEYRNYTDLLLIRGDAEHGDSGAVVYIINNMNLYAAGILKGGEYNVYYASKMSNLVMHGIYPLR